MAIFEVDTTAIVKPKKNEGEVFNIPKAKKAKKVSKHKSRAKKANYKTKDLSSNSDSLSNNDNTIKADSFESTHKVSPSGFQLQKDDQKTHENAALRSEIQIAEKATEDPISAEPNKKRKISETLPDVVSVSGASLTELSKLDSVTYRLGLIKQSLEEDNKVLFESHLLKSTHFVIDRVVLYFDKEIALKFIVMLYEILKSYSGSFKVLKYWTRSVLKYHGSLVFKDPLIVETFQKFLASSDARINSFNCLSKLSSRLDLILGQRKLMTASRKAELTKDLDLDSLSESEGTSEPSSGELSLDDQFYLNKSKLNESDFLGHGDSSSEYETIDEDLSTSVNGRLKRKSCDSGGE